jgi:hypothetical protein
MSAVTGQDSNLSSVRYCVESSQSTLPGSPVWKLTEPNTEPRFGVSLEEVERSFITEDRMSRKGSIVDKDPGVQLEQDFTVDNQMELLQSFMFGALRSKGQHAAITGVTATDDTFAAASGLGIFAANDLVFARGFTNAANNGLHLVTSATGTTLVVGTALVDETPPSGATVTKVGHQYASADVTVNAAGGRPILVTAAGDFRELNLVAGESIYIGGDATANQFAAAANNGCKRVYAVNGAGTQMTLDKSGLDMVTDASATGKSLRIFTGFALKNEQGANFFRQFVQFERTLGAPDDAQPTQVQSEYIPGSIGSEYSFDAPAANKITSTMTFMGQTYETRTGVVGVKSGDRPDLPEADAVNTSSDIKRFRVAQLSGSTDEAPTPLFALIQSMSFNINNSINRGTALGVVGAARFTVGRFVCGGQFDAYFADVAALDAVGNYADCTIDGFIATPANNGFAFDFPLVSLSSDGATVEQDEPIKMPCDFKAHKGTKYDATFDHALCWTFFPYLPTLARTAA